MTTTYRNYSGTAAELYQSFFVPAIASPVSTELLRTADLQPGERVLDVACGTGIITRAAAEAVGPAGSVCGIDVAPDMLEVARSIAAEGPAIDWREADAASVPLPADTFDVVLCQMGLMFMEDRAAALEEMHRLLAGGGRIVINTPGQIQPLFESMEQAIVEHLNPELGGFVRAVFSMHDPDALAALLRDAGFVAVESKEYQAVFSLPGPAEFLWSYINLTPMGPLVARGTRSGSGGHGAPGRRGVDPPRSGRRRTDRPAHGPRLGTAVMNAGHPAQLLGAGEEARRRLLQDVDVDDQRLELAGIATSLLVAGEGPPLVLLHGPGEFAERWVRVFPGLADPSGDRSRSARSWTLGFPPRWPRRRSGPRLARRSHRHLQRAACPLGPHRRWLHCRPLRGEASGTGRPPGAGRLARPGPLPTQPALRSGSPDSWSARAPRHISGS